MSKLAEKIIRTEVAKDKIALFYLGQSGFCFKTSSGRIIVLDAYLSDSCERNHGFKRMCPAVIDADELDADWYMSTHSHDDHLDIDALPIVAKNAKTRFLGSTDCRAVYRTFEIDEERFVTLSEGEEYDAGDLKVRAIYADHGELAPEAVGLLLEIDGIKIYDTGDTAFVPEKIKRSLNTPIDILIVPINGQFGNPNAEEACRLALELEPKIVIASHFWMFLQHVAAEGKGDPTTFLEKAEKMFAGKSIRPLAMASGESLIYPSHSTSPSFAF